MRGLVQFIADLRNARARELEEKRINKELANIRYAQRPHNPGVPVGGRETAPFFFYANEMLTYKSFSTRQKFKGSHRVDPEIVSR